MKFWFWTCPRTLSIDPLHVGHFLIPRDIWNSIHDLQKNVGQTHVGLTRSRGATAIERHMGQDTDSATSFDKPERAASGLFFEASRASAIVHNWESFHAIFTASAALLFKVSEGIIFPGNSLMVTGISSGVRGNCPANDGMLHSTWADKDCAW